jgi:hypothetical protein
VEIPMSIFMAVVFPIHLPQENQNFSLIDLKGNVINSGKAAKFLAEVSYFYDTSPISERKGVCPVLFGFLDCSCCLVPCKVLETLQEIISP